MERDFMGLAVKQETPDETIDAAPVRSLPMQWSFSNKGSAVPQLLSFQGAQEEKPKIGFDSLASTGLVTITTEAFDSDHKPYPAAQKNVVPEKQGGARYTVTTYPTHHVDTHSTRRPVTPQTNLTISPAVTTSIHQSFVGPLAGVPVASPVQASSPFVGTTDLRNSSKISGGPAQLTIFYNGSVCVYDNISPEKAQAIMLLAGNGPQTTPNATIPAAPVQASTPRSFVLDGLAISQPYGTTPHRSSPVPVTPISTSQSAGWCGIKTETSAAMPSGVLVSSPSIVEPLRAVNPLGSVSANFLSSGTVPQYRRKSLARFLEKRKERVITASPYADRQSPDCSTPGGGGTSLSVNSSGSCPVPAIN